MAYQPTHPHPYLESIDASNDLPGAFSVIINPKDIITQYSFYLYKITSSDDDGATSLLQIYTIDQSFIESQWLYGSEDGTSLLVDIAQPIPEFNNGGEYQWKVVLTDSNGISVESPLYYFTTKATPVITLDVPKTITTCKYSFKATYVQDQHEPYMYYQYDLYQNGVLIDSTLEKMDSLLSYTYSGFISGNKYRLDLTIMTVDRNLYKLSKNFDVEYSIQPSVLFSTVNSIQDRNCVEVDYSQNLFIKGNTNCEVTYNTFENSKTSESFIGATLPKDEAIYYNKINEYKPLKINDNFTVYYSVHFSGNFTGDIIVLSDESLGNKYVVRYDGKKFYYKIGYNSEVAIDPYVNDNMVHQENSIVQKAGTTISDLNYDTLYVLYEDDVISNSNIILYNDITANFWWNFVLLPDKVVVYRGAKYIESEVS